MYEWRTGRSCVFKNTVHLVFVTKYRRGVFSTEMLARTKEVMQETCLQMDCELHEFNGEHDHVHMLVSIHPKLAVSNLVGKLKGKSSFVIRREFWDRVKTMLWGKHFWSPSYCCVSVGGATLDVVKRYIENQRVPTSERNASKSTKLRRT